MGFKTESNAIEKQSNYKVKGLIFSTRNGYDSLKNIDANANHLVDAIKAGSLDMKEFFGRFDKTKVKETHANAAENLEFIFPNITRLICLYDPDYFKTELDFGDNFYSLMDIEYIED